MHEAISEKRLAAAWAWSSEPKNSQLDDERLERLDRVRRRSRAEEMAWEKKPLLQSLNHGIRLTQLQLVMPAGKKYPSALHSSMDDADSPAVRLVALVFVKLQ
jgi:hypothetical protein